MKKIRRKERKAQRQLKQQQQQEIIDDNRNDDMQFQRQLNLKQARYKESQFGKWLARPEAESDDERNE